MRRIWLCLFYSVCTFTIVFSLFWMALPKLELPAPSAGSETPASDPSLAAQALPELAPQRFYLCDRGGKVAVYLCDAAGSPGILREVTSIYTNLLPENDALRIKRGMIVQSERELDLLLEDLGG